MFKTKPTITEAERTRLDEISFCFFVEKLMKGTIDPMRVFDLIDLVCATGNCSFLILRNVLSTVLTNDHRIMPTKKEQLYLLYKAGYPVRYITKVTRTSQRDYYKLIQGDFEDVNTQPRFEHIQSKEISKFLDTLEQLLPERRF